MCFCSRTGSQSFCVGFTFIRFVFVIVSKTPPVVDTFRFKFHKGKNKTLPSLTFSLLHWRRTPNETQIRMVRTPESSSELSFRFNKSDWGRGGGFFHERYRLSRKKGCRDTDWSRGVCSHPNLFY